MVILKEGWTFSGSLSKMRQTKVIIVRPIDVTSYMYGLH